MISFEIFSRYTGKAEDSFGNTLAPVEIKRPLGGSSKDRILAAAAEHGWHLEHGFQGSAALRHGGSVIFRDQADFSHYVHAEFGRNGQVTYLRIERGNQGRREPRNRCELALAELTGDPAEARDRATRRYDRGQAGADFQAAVAADRESEV